MLKRLASLVMLVLSTAPDVDIVAAAERPFVRARSGTRPVRHATMDGHDIAAAEMMATESADDASESESDSEDDEDGVPATPFAMACIYGRANVV